METGFGRMANSKSIKTGHINAAAAFKRHSARYVLPMLGKIFANTHDRGHFLKIFTKFYLKRRSLQVV